MSDAGGQGGQGAELVYWWSPRGDDRVFDLVGWPAEAVAVVRSMLATAEVDHRWEGERLVVPAENRNEAQEVLDEVVAASRPRLEDAEDRVAYELGDWPPGELDVLESALDRDGILHEWTEDGELLVYQADEDHVDALFDELGLRGPDDGRVQLEGDELTRLLNEVYVATDRLARNARDPDAVVGSARAADDIAQVRAPMGFDEGAWERLVERLGELRDILAGEDETADDEEVSGRARDIRDRLRAWL
jgi:hypothetical protein